MPPTLDAVPLSHSRPFVRLAAAERGRPWPLSAALSACRERWRAERRA